MDGKALHIIRAPYSLHSYEVLGSACADSKYQVNSKASARSLVHNNTTSIQAPGTRTAVPAHTRGVQGICLWYDIPGVYKCKNMCLWASGHVLRAVYLVLRSRHMFKYTWYVVIVTASPVGKNSGTCRLQRTSQIKYEYIRLARQTPPNTSHTTSTLL